MLRLGLSSFAFFAVALPLLASTACTSHDEDIAGAADSLRMSDLPVRINASAAGTFTQALDHQAAPDAPSATFTQRYWYTTEFARGPESPVLYYFCGEQTCGTWALERMADTAKSLHASVVALEHRYYGQSRAFTLEQMTPENMRFLTMHQALEDAAEVQRTLTRDLPLKGKWISVGGSYSGMLAAFYRVKHPELVVGAWASSAPVNVQKTFWGADAITARSLGPVCLSHFKQALGTAERAYDNVEERNRLSNALFGVDWNEEWGKGSFLGSISGAPRSAAQGGQTSRLCAALLQHEQNPIDGIIAYYRPPLVPDDEPTPPPSVAEPATISLGPGDFARPLPGEEEREDWRVLGRAWSYQTCTEVGFFEVRNPDPAQSVESAAADVTEAEYDADCRDSWGTTPDIARTRAEYYAPLLDGRGSNIFWVNGSFDPWSALSFNDPSAPPTGSTVFVIQQGAHHVELANLERTSPIAVFEAHVKFHDLASRWVAE